MPDFAVAALEARLTELRAGLAHLNAAILLLDPAYELAGIPLKRSVALSGGP